MDEIIPIKCVEVLRKVDYVGVLLAFVIGLTAIVRIEIHGVLALNEILVIAISPFCLKAISSQFRLRYLRLVLYIGVAYLMSAVISDIYRGTPAADYLRGWARIGITLLSILVSIPIVLKSKHRILAFLVGWFLAPILDIALHPDNPAPFKFYIGPSLSAFAFIAVGLSPRALRLFSHFVVVVVASVAFWQDSRSLAAITIVAHVMYLVSGRGGQADAISKRIKRFVFVATVLVAVSCGIFLLYTFSAPLGYFGVAAQDKYNAQILTSESQKFNLLSGRKELHFVWPKIAESPWIGYGSWPKDWGYVQSTAKELGGVNVVELLGSEQLVDAGLIPAHSHIFGAWLETGVIGAIFWLVVALLLISLFVNGFSRVPSRLIPVFIYILITFSWDLLFSPYGAGRRFWDGFVIAWIISGLSGCTGEALGRRNLLTSSRKKLKTAIPLECSREALTKTY